MDTLMAFGLILIIISIIMPVFSNIVKNNRKILKENEKILTKQNILERIIGEVYHYSDFTNITDIEGYEIVIEDIADNDELIKILVKNMEDEDEKELFVILKKQGIYSN